jgi:hypothetical protein
MAIEQKIILPTALETNNFAAGTIADVDEGVTSPDGNWLTVTGRTADGDSRISFPSTGGGLLSGTQTFRVHTRKVDATGGGDPTLVVDLYESGSLVSANIINTTIADETTGTTHSGTWDPSTVGLADSSGVNIEMLVTITSIGGGPNSRSGDLGAVEWEAQYNAFRKFFWM